MNDEFQFLLRKFMLIFLDDILIFNYSYYTHLHHLKIVVQVLEKERLYVKLIKCSFGTNVINHLGHTIINDGVQMDKNKVKMVLE